MKTPEIPRLTRAADQPYLLEALDEFGAVIIEGFLTEDVLRAIAHEVRPHLATADPAMDHISPALQTFFAGVRNVTGLTTKSPTFVDEVLLDPTLLGLVDTILTPNAASVSLNVAHLMVREPGAQQQWLHRDQNVWSFVPEPHPELELASMTALTDFTAENGATIVVPGSHRWEPGREPLPHELRCAEMRAGSTVVYLGSTIHAGGTNSSRQSRAGLHLSYVVGWLRTEENHSLSAPPDEARMLPKRAQELVGYAPHDASSRGGGYLGLVDMHSPLDLLTAGAL